MCIILLQALESTGCQISVPFIPHTTCVTKQTETLRTAHVQAVRFAIAATSAGCSSKACSAHTNVLVALFVPSHDGPNGFHTDVKRQFALQRMRGTRAPRK